MFTWYNTQELIKVEGYSVVCCERKVTRESIFSPQNYVWKKAGKFCPFILDFESVTAKDNLWIEIPQWQSQQ